MVLYAYDKPVVVRKKGDYYQKVSGCFVNGLMKGEAVADVESGKAKAKVITFC